MKRKFNRLLKQVKNKLVDIQKLSDEELQNKTVEFKERLNKGESLNKLLPEAFAVVCETDKRILGMMPFDCQIVGAIALHYCYLAEMNTGEGKTLTATMPLYLNALTGKSTILVTANDYLARRDADEMGPVYRFLGLTVMAGVSDDPDKQIENEEKKKIYNADIVYTTHGTLGFDYLLNNLVKSADDRFLRKFNYVIVDEADMVLMDAAQMPLVISGVPRVQSNLYEITDFFVTTLEEDKDYIKEDNSVYLSDAGVEYAERFFGIDHFYDAENFEINRHVTLALRSHVLTVKDKDYVITEKGEISLLDNGTGRSLPGMKLRGGSHQAIEAKEKLKLSQENRSMASITFQNLFLLFPKLSGMSGTISDAKKELKKIYKKSVAIIPPNKPLQRIDRKDLFFRNAEEQYDAAINDVLQIHATGQPVLVVTSTIANSEAISKALLKKHVPHSVLNANSAYWEAQIIKEAGKKGTITVSTGMAGRGTDIRLQEGSKELGGLAIIGIGRMSNTRLERQTRGRAGRQGDPGFSQFYVSLEDEIVKKTEEKRTKKYVEGNKNISKLKLKKIINNAQKLQEDNAVTQRKMNVEYDKVVKHQRNMIYDVRDRLLDGGTLEDKIINKLIKENISFMFQDNEKITTRVVTRYILDNITYDLDDTFLKGSLANRLFLKRSLTKYAFKIWKEKINSFASKEEEKEFIRRCSLQAVDDAWVEQIDYLQQLQNLISGRSSAQKNPVFEYYNEAYESFQLMERTIKKTIFRNIFLGTFTYDKKGKMVLLLP